MKNIEIKLFKDDGQGLQNTATIEFNDKKFKRSNAEIDKIPDMNVKTFLDDHIQVRLNSNKFKEIKLIDTNSNTKIIGSNHIKKYQNDTPEIKEYKLNQEQWEQAQEFSTKIYNHYDGLEDGAETADKVKIIALKLAMDEHNISIRDIRSAKKTIKKYNA